MTFTLLMLGLAGCVGSSVRKASPSSAGPTILTVTPTPFLLHEGSNAVLTIRGESFSADSNSVRIGAQQWDGIPSQDAGTRIQFIVPDRVPSGGGAAPMLWASGEYAVSVRTRQGVSRAVSLTIQTSP